MSSACFLFGIFATSSKQSGHPVCPNFFLMNNFLTNSRSGRYQPDIQIRFLITQGLYTHPPPPPTKQSDNYFNSMLCKTKLFSVLFCCLPFFLKFSSFQQCLLWYNVVPYLRVLISFGQKFEEIRTFESSQLTRKHWAPYPYLIKYTRLKMVRKAITNFRHNRPNNIAQQ